MPLIINEQEFLTYDEAATALGVKKSTIYAATYHGQIPSYRVKGHGKLILRADINRFKAGVTTGAYSQMQVQEMLNKANMQNAAMFNSWLSRFTKALKTAKASPDDIATVLEKIEKEDAIQENIKRGVRSYIPSDNYEADYKNAMNGESEAPKVYIGKIVIPEGIDTPKGDTYF